MGNCNQVQPQKQHVLQRKNPQIKEQKLTYSTITSQKPDLKYEHQNIAPSTNERNHSDIAVVIREGISSSVSSSFEVISRIEEKKEIPKSCGFYQMQKNSKIDHQEDIVKSAPGKLPAC